MPGALLSRRALLARCMLILVPSIVRGRTFSAEISSRLRALEETSGTRIGLAAFDTGPGRVFNFRDDMVSGQKILYRENERFLFCSTWKFLVVAALLARVDRGEEQLNRTIRFTKVDLVPHAPVTELHLESGMTLGALCDAAMTVSDNTAANLLLTAVGGFAGFTAFVRSLGDATTNLVRDEPEVNTPDGDKDTTSPAAMLQNMAQIMSGTALKPESRQKMLGWLYANTTGDTFLRAGLPQGWKVGDKTGHGSGASNDLAIAIPLERKPVFIAAYTMARDPSKPSPTVLAEVGRIVAGAFGA